MRVGDDERVRVGQGLDHREIGVIAGGEAQRAGKPANSAISRSSSVWIDSVPETSREAPAPAPYVWAAATAPATTRGSRASPR